ncbi:hypothetical protein PR048_032907, partial [Dryococelus australis]
MDTLNVGDKMIRNTIKKTCDGVVEEYMRGKHMVGKTLADMHRDYVKECQEQGRSHGTYAAYRNIFLIEFKISFFVPKNDLCAFCEKVKNAEDKELLANEYKEHRKEIEQKKLSIQTLQNKTLQNKVNVLLHDPDLAKQGKCVTACFDFQAVLPTHCGDVSAFHYKRRLSVLNFTIYDLGRNIGHCYVWHEGAGRRVTGDHLHSMIEKQKKLVFKSGPISLPAEWITVIQMAKKRGDPLKVTETDTQDFMDFKTLSKFYGTNFSVNTDKEKNSWQSMREIKVEKEKPFQFSYKTSFGGTSKTILTRKVTRGRPSIPKLSNVYTSPPGVTE